MKKTVFKEILVTILLTVLALPVILGLLYGVVLIWASTTDAKYAKIADEIIDVKAAEYIAENYPNNDFDVGEASYAFIDNCFYVKIQSRSSQDTHFTLSYHYITHQLLSDTYASSVLSGSNTCTRLVTQYDTLIEETLATMSGIYRLKGDLCRYSENESRGLYYSPKGIDQELLVVDREYDIHEIGEHFGYIEVEFLDTEENINIERAAEILLEMDNILTESDTGYYVIDFTVSSGTYEQDPISFHIYGVTKEDLTCDDPLARLQEMWDEQEAHRQALKEEWSQ